MRDTADFVMRQFNTIALVALLASLSATAAAAQDWNNSGAYNGYGAMNQNSASNFRLRDDNNNLTMVNGQFTSGNIGANQGNQQASAGVGTGGAGAAYGQATAIGNQLQVQVIGFNNTVIVDSTQINTGNQTAGVNLNKY
jgi:holdfast attachment protein HfaA